MELFAWVGEDEFGSGEVGLKQAQVPAGMIPIVSVDQSKAEQETVQEQLQTQADRSGKPIRLVRFVEAEVLMTIEPHVISEGVRLEMKAPGGEGWMTMARQPKVEPGSMSSYPPNAPRQIILFGWIDGEGPAVWRSDFGADTEVGHMREVLSSRRTKIADLGPEPVELSIFSPVAGEVLIRLTTI